MPTTDTTRPDDVTAGRPTAGPVHARWAGWGHPDDYEVTLTLGRVSHVCTVAEAEALSAALAEVAGRAREAKGRDNRRFAR